VFVTLFASVLAQVPIPNTYPGHFWGSPEAPVILECYFDHVCSDSAASWPTIQQVQAHYGSAQLLLVVHITALPYHRNAFFTQQAGDIVYQAKGDPAFFQFMTAVFNNQPPLQTPQTMNMTGNQIIQVLATYASPFVDQNDFVQGMALGSPYEEEAIADWKWATSKGVSGTPTFAVNGVFVQADQTWTLSDWEQILDPLFQQPAGKGRGKQHKQS